jgi:hypothetical protein
MKTYTNTQLKQALAKMLPEKTCLQYGELCWYLKKNKHHGCTVSTPPVLDTELLHLCWLATNLSDLETVEMYVNRQGTWTVFLKTKTDSWISCDEKLSTAWIVALCKVKGLEII